MAEQSTIERYTGAFGAQRGGLAGSGLPWLSTLRDDAIATFGDIGFPGKKNEDWKYTSVSALVGTEFVAPDASVAEARRADIARAVAALPVADGDIVLVFADGRYVGDLSRLCDVTGVQASSLAELLGKGDGAIESVFGRCLDAGSHGFAALNAAFAADGAVVTIGKGVAASNTIHVLHYATAAGAPTISHARNIVVAEAGSNARVVEHYGGDQGADALGNVVTELILSDDAHLSHAVVQCVPETATHIHRIEARQARGSNLRSHVVTLGAELSRIEVRVVLDGEGAECSLDGLYALADDQHADHHTLIDHAAPHTNSRELYKGIIDDDARGVFTGRIIVRPDSQHINADQANRNLLLADGAVAEARPQLEIYADDVKCSHGCTVGRLNEESMFYMRQRGIGETEARRLLTVAFAGEVLDELGDEDLARALRGQLTAKLAHETRTAGDTNGSKGKK
jgi:Fe-S cluster assembly protein SufD